MEKSLGELIDELSVTNIRIWMAEDIKRNPKATDKQISDATRLTNSANTHRNKLIDAINKAVGVNTSKGDKLYGRK